MWLGLEFQLDKEPKRLIELVAPTSDDAVEIRPVKGRTFGDAAETPAVLTYKGKRIDVKYVKGSGSAEVMMADA